MWSPRSLTLRIILQIPLLLLVYYFVRSLYSPLPFLYPDSPSQHAIDALATVDPIQLMTNMGFSLEPSYVQRNVSVVWMTYPGGGGALLGETLGRLPGVFYLEEPHLSLFYPAMYGVRTEGSVAFNVLMDHRGGIRRFPNAEANQSINLLRSVFDCHMSRLPLAMLLSPYWGTVRQPYVSQYVQCAHNSGIQLTPPNDSLAACRDVISGVCPPLFTTNPSMGFLRIRKCNAVLYGKGSFAEDTDPSLWEQFEADPSFKQTRIKFEAYFSCLRKYESQIRSCAENHLDATCSKSAVKMISGSSFTMYMIQELLASYLHLHFIHLLRDPRAVGHLRTEQGPVVGQYATYESSDPRTLSKFYCRVAMDHVTTGIQLKKDNLERVLGLSFDKMLHNLSNNTFSLMRYLGINPTITGAVHLSQYFRLEGRNIVFDSFRWKESLSRDDVSAISEQCGRLLDEISDNVLSLESIKLKYVI